VTRVLLSGRVADTGAGTSALLLHPAGCPCSAGWDVLGLDPAAAAVARSPGPDPAPVALVVLAEHDAGPAPRFLQPKQTAEAVRSNALWLAAVHSGPAGGTAGWAQVRAVLARSAGAIVEFAAAVPAFATGLDGDGDADPLGPVRSVLRDGQRHALPETDLATLRSVQRRMAEVYGRLEIERALTWTTEELVELAQSVRRGEGRARLGEELGQLFAWVMCLGNILDLDVASAGSTALWREATRQLTKHGRVWPYVPGEPRP
jgi:NTP pyrophosphatase (non-canonical NTP hydrolase)